MRIRKGNRCLPLAPSDRPFLQQQEASTVTQREKGCSDVKEPDVEANQAMLRLVALAAAPRPIADNVKYLEHANGASPVRNKCLEHDLEKNRVSADDNFNERSLIHDKGTPPRTKSVFTRHKPAVTTGAICSTSDQPGLLEPSLLPICSRAANAGLNGHDGVAPILEQVFPGLIEGDDRLAVQVATSFRNSSKSAELEEQGRIVSQLSPAGEENKSLIIGDSEISRGETVSSSDMIEAAIQLQNMQKSYSNSLCSGVVELSETPSIHCGNQEAAQNQTKGFHGRSKVGPNYTDVTTMNHKASSSASKSRNVTQTGQSESQCKRDDGKGWRCSRPAEGGYTMCKYHREQICRAQSRRKRSKFDAEPVVAVKTSPSRYLLNARFVPNAIFTANDCLPFTDDELAYDERRPLVKAKSLKSLLLNTHEVGEHQVILEIATDLVYGMKKASLSKAEMAFMKFENMNSYVFRGWTFKTPVATRHPRFRRSRYSAPTENCCSESSKSRTWIEVLLEKVGQIMKVTQLQFKIILISRE